MWRLGYCPALALFGAALVACTNEVDVVDTTGAGGERAGTGAANGSGSGIVASGTGGAPSTSVSTSGPGPGGTSSVSSTDAVSSGMMTTASSTSSGGPVGLTCADPIAITLGPGSISVPGTTIGALNLPHPYDTSGSTCFNTDGPERVYVITALETGTVTAWLPAATTTFQSALIRAPWNDCEAVGECFDNWGTPNEHGGEVVTFRVQQGDFNYLIVEGVSGDAGDYVLELDLSTGGDCSDPIPIHVEGQGPILLHSSIADANDDLSCQSGQNVGPEVVFEVTVTDTDTYQYYLYGPGGVSKVASVRSTCDVASTELDCQEPEIVTPLMAGETVYLFIDREPSPSSLPGWVDASIIHYF
ncbi:MAG: hypothetical protein HOV80_34245 [Polyangiaceae bacterium]|nr:hypothetical protein [Polyangiaceae bacterium]